MIVEQLRASAARHAERVAIEPADAAPITYAELFARARDRAAAIAPGSIVPVEHDRSAAWVIDVLAAWLAGAAFVPVGGVPPARRAHMLARVREVDARDLAYVIFTSGSSGAPKGVMVTHAGLPALARAQIDAFALAPGARMLWLHAGVFDASVSDVITTLGSGATLVLAPPAPARLRATLEGRAITHVDLPTALLPQLAGELPSSLACVVLGGEACDVDAVRALAARARVVVVYGPTEATVCSSLVVVDPASWRAPLIGDPLPGVRYRVEPDGELWIGGACLARGYAGEPDETAARFVRDAGDDGARWYRTGDRVEAIAGGGLAFRGRLDRQVKVGGRRIELDEVERALASCAGVREAAAAVRDGRLVAWIVGGDEAGARAAVRAWLPAWMVPSSIVRVDALPRGATGKLDRAMLASGSPIAQELAPLWCAATGATRALDAQTFADAGGDSLAALVLTASADARGVPLEPAWLDDDPTFADLAARVAHAIEDAPAPPTVAACEARAPRAGTRGRVHTDGTVLFTGATGFLGPHLVRAWRARDPRPILCLVRARDDHAAHARVRDTLGDVDAIAGDLAHPLPEATRARIHADVTAIVHAAARVDLTAGWDALAPSNVGGAAAIAALCAEGRAPAWHHVSTLAVFVGTDRGAGRHAPDDVPPTDARVFGAYAATKIAAEAIARASATTIARLGLLVDPDAQAPRTQLAMTLRGLARLGAIPDNARALRLDLTPVAHAARAIVDAALAGRAMTHVAHPRGVTLADLAHALRAHGVDLVECAPDAWADRARARFADADIAMAYLSLARAHAPASSRLRAFDLFLATDADFAPDAPAPDCDLGALIAQALT